MTDSRFRAISPTTTSSRSIPNDPRDGSESAQSCALLGGLTGNNLLVSDCRRSQSCVIFLFLINQTSYTPFVDFMDTAYDDDDDDHQQQHSHSQGCIKAGYDGQLFLASKSTPAIRVLSKWIAREEIHLESSQLIFLSHLSRSLSLSPSISLSLFLYSFSQFGPFD